MWGFPIYTKDKTSPRAFRWIWYIRIFQILVTLVVLAITAANAASFENESCSVPGKLAWNLACAVLALLALAYFLLSTGPTPIFKIIPWWIIIQLTLDSLMFIFWLSAAATSRYNCDDLCNACPNFSALSFDDLSCACGGAYDWYWKRGMSPKPSGLLQKRRTYTRRAGTYGAKRGLDAVMVVLFFATLVSTVVWIFQNRRASQSSTTTAPTSGPAPHPEAGVQQVQAEPKQDISAYPANPPMQQQGGYPPVSPQEGYAPQGQYPPQGQQYPQQGYPPQQQQYPQQGYPPQGQQQPMAYYNGSNEGVQRQMSPPMQQQAPPQQQQQHEGVQVPNYPTPTPEMQAERREM